jgi:hypothetical protein
MAAAPQWKVYDSEGVYQAACKEIEAAAALASFYGDGSTIRQGHSHTVWTEGVDGHAGDSYDEAVSVIICRLLPYTR